MNSLVYTGVQQLSYQPTDAPQVATGEALVKVAAAGICGSDMHAFLGHDARRVPPLVLGHEIAGTVVGGSNDGKDVVVNPLIGCHQCDYCLDGRGNLCPHRTMLGMTRAGGFADYLSVPEHNLIFSDELNPIHAALCEPAATVLHALRLVERSAWRPLPESKVCIIGGGAIGMLGYLFLRAFGVSDISLSETNPLRRSNYQDGDVRLIDPTRERLEPNSFDIVLDVVGLQITRQSAIDAVRPGGVIMHIGLGEDRGDMDARKLTLGEVAFLGTYTYNMIDMRQSLKYLQEGRLGDLSWVETMPLSRGQEAFEALLSGKMRSPKIVLLPEDT